MYAIVHNYNSMCFQGYSENPNEVRVPDVLPRTRDTLVSLKRD